MPQRQHQILSVWAEQIEGVHALLGEEADIFSKRESGGCVGNSGNYVIFPGLKNFFGSILLVHVRSCVL